MTSSWNDFNDTRQASNLIPKGTLAKVRLSIRPGGYDDSSQGWTGGYATRANTGAVYLNGEFTVLAGPYARRKIFTLIGLHSPKGPEWSVMGRSFVRGILNSARGLSAKDASSAAQTARRIAGFGDLDGLEFVARVEVSTDSNGEEKNEIRSAITPDHVGYAAAMASQPATAGATRTSSSPSGSGAGDGPAWAR